MNTSSILIQISNIADFKGESFSLKTIIPQTKNLNISIVAAPISSILYNCSEKYDDMVFLTQFDDQVHVLPSLQRPKKIHLICSDGVKRPFLCKPKDDLRKDMRFLELAYMTNFFIRGEEKLFTYSVVPLKEDNGLVEWITNTSTLRSILKSLYSERGISLNCPEFKTINQFDDPLKHFEQNILTRYLATAFPSYLSDIRHYCISGFTKRISTAACGSNRD